jgi:hypothetical protein
LPPWARLRKPSTTNVAGVVWNPTMVFPAPRRLPGRRVAVANQIVAYRRSCAFMVSRQSVWRLAGISDRAPPTTGADDRPSTTAGGRTPTGQQSAVLVLSPRASSEGVRAGVAGVEDEHREATRRTPASRPACTSFQSVANVVTSAAVVIAGCESAGPPLLPAVPGSPRYPASRNAYRRPALPSWDHAPLPDRRR